MAPITKLVYNFIEKKSLETREIALSFINSKEFQNCFFKAKTQFFHFSEQPKKLHHYCIEKLTCFDKTLDHALPNWIFQSVMDKAGHNIQQKIDQVGQYIRAQLGIHVSFNEWLSQNDGETWYEQLDIYLCKLPLKMIYNIVSLLSHIIESICYAAVHPLKALNHLAQFLLHIVYAFTQPETWCLLGAGMISSSAGQSLTSGNPLFLLGIVIGSGLAASGLALSALKAGITAKEGNRLQSAENAAKTLLKQIPETMLGSFCMGLLIGKIQQLSLKHFKSSMAQLQKQYADDFIKNNPGLGKYSSIHLDTSGNLILTWDDPASIGNVFTKVPRGPGYQHLTPKFLIEAEIKLSPDKLCGTTTYRYYYESLTYHFDFNHLEGVVHPSIYSHVVHPQTALIRHMMHQEIVNQAGGALGSGLPAISEAVKAS